jgi:hypothetical protein
MDDLFAFAALAYEYSFLARSSHARRFLFARCFLHRLSALASFCARVSGFRLDLTRGVSCLETCTVLAGPENVALPDGPIGACWAGGAARQASAVLQLDPAAAWGPRQGEAGEQTRAS